MPTRASRPDGVTDTVVVIPAYNEAATIARVAGGARAFADVCVVDDGSHDRTAEIVAALPGIHVIRHPRNTHIAGALRDGMAYAAERGYRHCITMDAGLSHDPEEIPRFMACRDVDLVLGFRARRTNVPWHRLALSRGATFVVNAALNPFGLPWGSPRFGDVTSGFRMYSRAAVDVILSRPLRSRSFDFHLETLALVYRAGLTIREIPISYAYSSSSLNARVVRDALKMWTYLISDSGRRAKRGCVLDGQRGR